MEAVMSREQPLLDIVFAQAKPERVEEFASWCWEVHGPGVLKWPGFLSCNVYQALDDETRFMAAYDINGPEVLGASGLAPGWEWMEDAVAEARSVLYQHIYTAPPGAAARSGAQAMLLRFNRSDVGPEREEEYNRWYNYAHLPELLDCPGWLGASRYKALEGTPRYLAMYDLSGPPAFESPEFLKARGWKEMEPHVFGLNNVTYRPIFEGQTRP
jgi:hypothetical protein